MQASGIAIPYAGSRRTGPVPDDVADDVAAVVLKRLAACRRGDASAALSSLSHEAARAEPLGTGDEDRR